MAIEIKELVVKFSVEDNRSNSSSTQETNRLNNKQVMKEIVKQCTSEVLEKLSKLEDR